MQDDTQVDLNEVPTSTPELNAEEGVVPQGEAGEQIDTTEKEITDGNPNPAEEPVAPQVAE